MTTMTSSAERAANWWRNRLFSISFSENQMLTDALPLSPMSVGYVNPDATVINYSVLEDFYRELTSAILSEICDNGSVTLQTVHAGAVGILAEVCQATGVPDNLLPNNVTMTVDDFNVTLHK